PSTSFLFILPPPTSTLFPYTTLFRSQGRRFFLEGDPAGGQGGQAHHADADGHAHHSQERVDPQMEGGQVEHGGVGPPDDGGQGVDRKSTRLNSSHVSISYAVFCSKKK